MKLLENKIAIVTGAARGIGEAIAVKLAEHGAHIAFTYVSESSADKAAALVTKLEGMGVKAKAWRSNAGNFAESEAFVNDVVKEFIFSSRLAKIASDLMQTDGVRIYHDQALFKESGGGITPWHADQYYWPLETDKTITAWIPLQATPLELGPLEFSAGSHQIIEGRDLEISDESEIAIQQKLRVTDFKHVIEPFDAGEISFHSGWVFHRAGANVTNQMRKVMTIIFMDKDMKLKAPENKNQINDWNTWCPGATVGEVINSAINPIIYQR
jgi:hypothetical protein